MSKEHPYVWTDINYRKYRLKDLTDSHLKNIINHVNKGGGYQSTMTVRNMERLYDEAVRRGLDLPMGKFEFMDNAKATIDYVDHSYFDDDNWHGQW